MRRWIIVLLMVVLPCQYVWAAAAQYCAHDAQACGTHFGHHEHKHKAAVGEVQDGGSLGHPDCGTCHFASCTGVPAAFGMPQLAAPSEAVSYQPPYFLSRIPSGLERPQRLAPPLAVRFGSGSDRSSLT